MNAFSKMVSVILAILVLFVAPIIYFTQQQDKIVANFVDSQTAKFVSTIRNTGVITADQYDNFIETLDSTNNVYDIEITHSSLVVNPEYTTSTVNDPTTKLTSEYYVNTYEDTIRKALYETSEAEYVMAKGDYVTVQVTVKNKTIATKMQELIFGRGLQAHQIVAVYGGVIKDEGI